MRKINVMCFAFFPQSVSTTFFNRLQKAGENNGLKCYLKEHFYFHGWMKRHHIATHSLSSPITSETVPLKFPGNFQKFPKKLEALLLVAQLGTGNFYRF